MALTEKQKAIFSRPAQTETQPTLTVSQALARKQVQTGMQKTAPKVPDGFFSKASKLSEKTFGRASQALFGTVGETVGKTIIGGAESAAELIEGAKIPQEEKLGFDVGSRQEGATPSVTDIGFTVLELLPGGKGATKLLRKIPGGAKLADTFGSAIKGFTGKQKEKAIKLFTEALAPTKIETKAQAARIVPELLKRKEKAGILSGLGKLEKKAEKELIDLGSKIDDVIEGLPGEIKVQAQPILDSLLDFKKKFVVGGKVVSKRGADAAEGVLDVIKQFGDKVSVKELTQIKRILDAEVSAAKGFVGDVATKFSAQAQGKATDAIRKEFAKDVPLLDNLNKEFSFWKNVENVTGETIKRKAGQSGILRKGIFTTVGAFIGNAFGPKGAVAGSIIGNKLGQAFTSAAWKTRSATWRNSFADNIVNLDVEKILGKLKVLGVITNNEIDEIKKDL